ncbi:MAG: OmpA family protein [Pseudomonadota bacterium]|nr:OmpA family protein [Pseudomonadota bacterium]
MIKKSRNLVRALVLAGLACLVFTASTSATEAQVAVGALDTSVKLLSLQAGEAFAFDEAELSDAGKAKLDAVLADLKEEYVYRADVTGYTDSIGDEAYNLDLSFRRAQAVVGHLKMSGILPERIKTYARGSADPIVTCEEITGEDLIACLAPNRRTEVRFSFPRAHTEGVVLAREQLSTAAGEYVALYAAPVASSDFAAKAIKVFKEGCRADLDAYCSQVTPGDQRLLACLYAHDDKVSAQCKGSVLDALLLVKAEFAQANFIGALCGSDILDHCGGVEPGDGRIAACLKEKGALLTEPCRESLQNLPQ